MSEFPSRLKKLGVAIAGAFTVAASGYLSAEAGFEKFENTTFYKPTFTKEDVQKFNEAQKLHAQGDVFVGNPGMMNRHVNSFQREVFTPQENVTGEQRYIVQLSESPLAIYANVPQQQLTSPLTQSASQKFDLNSVEASNYKTQLKQMQMSVVNLAASKGAQIEVTDHYTIANNAVAVTMTQRDAEILATIPGVKRITPSRVLKVRTDRGPEFINAPMAWDGTVAPEGIGAQGEGMVVGIIDTGINTDHPAFMTDSEYAVANPRKDHGFYGDCIEDETLCNDKLIGVYSYDVITDVYNAPEFQQYSWQTNFIRPKNGEDYNGHGSHVASTVAGNPMENVPLQAPTGEATSDGLDLPFEFPSTSGVAPRAHIISYQVCWPGVADDPYAGCPEEAILAAFEDAIEDQVDVINFSIGGAEAFPWEDPMELAFLAARQAGINVAAAAGNSGPYFSTADHTSPWVTTVGAVTHDRQLNTGMTSITDFEGTAPSYQIPTEIEGKGYTDSITGEFVLAENFPDPDTTDAFNAAQCNVPFPAGTFTADQIVVCERGDIPRVDKAVNVAAGGAGGLVLVNKGYSDPLVADKFVIPGINVAASNKWKLKNWINNSGGTARATINTAVNDYNFDGYGNTLATFSSMGPSRFINNLVPDLAAPGVDIFAANADDQPFTQYPTASDWTIMSGTSMASPHVAGAMTLLAQMHPEWSPAEIQSALMLTANEVKFQPRGANYEPEELWHNFMAGSGAIDVAKASQTGLVMHETYENYVDANPNNGGVESWLNIPSMVNMECESECSWIRTVTATKDGSWTAEAMVNGQTESGVEFVVQPSSFTLKKGESQTLIVKAKVDGLVTNKVDPVEPGAPWEMDTNFAIYNGQLVLTEASAMALEAHMPIVLAGAYDQLPATYDVSFNRSQGSETMMVNTDYYSQFTARTYGLVKPKTYTFNAEGVTGFFSQDNLERGWHIEAITVPEGTKNLVIEVLGSEQTAGPTDNNGKYSSHSPLLTIGFDKNENGTFIPGGDISGVDMTALRDEYWSEIVCQSSSSVEANTCNFIDPKPGTYWIAVTNIDGVHQGRKGMAHDIEVGYALLDGSSDQGNLTVSGPASHDGNGNYNLELTWDLPNAKEGDVYFGGFDMGNMPGAEGSIGFTSLRFDRGQDNISMEVSQTKARNMDVIDIEIEVLPNLESEDRAYEFNFTVPEGMRIAPATMTVNSDEIAELIEIDESSIKLSGVQESTRDIMREYVVTNSQTDMQCHTPMIDEYSDGGYIDLHEFGMQPDQEWYVGADRDYYDIPMWWLFYGMDQEELKLYNQPSLGYMRFHPVGAMQLNNAYWIMRQHRGPGFLIESISPFWRGNFEVDNFRNPTDPRGMTMAAQYASERPDLGDLLFIEVDNVKDKVTGDTFDYQTILRPNVDFREGYFEMMFAYDNLNGDVKDGAIFVEGFDSAYSRDAGPKDGPLYTVVGFDNLDEVIQDDTVLCFDYNGPEKSGFKMTVKAVVQPEATGQDLDLTLDVAMDGQDDTQMVHTIEVAGNIKVADMADMMVEEDGMIEDLEVLYVDANSVPNTVSVSGEHITAQVDGTSFSITPDENFNGETEVTVTVTDNELSGDSASTSFMLTVSPVNDAPEAVVTSSFSQGTLTLDASGSIDVDGDNLMYAWSTDSNMNTDAWGNTPTIELRGLSAGGYVFEVEVSDGIETSVAEVTVDVSEDNQAPSVSTSSKKGGAAFYLFALLGLATMLRRKIIDLNYHLFDSNN